MNGASLNTCSLVSTVDRSARPAQTKPNSKGQLGSVHGLRCGGAEMAHHELIGRAALTEQIQPCLLAWTLEHLDPDDEVPYLSELSDRLGVHRLGCDEADELERDRRARLGMQSSQRVSENERTSTTISHNTTEDIQV